jgi:hypothetical protein
MFAMTEKNTMEYSGKANGMLKYRLYENESYMEEIKMVPAYLRSKQKSGEESQRLMLGYAARNELVVPDD